MLGRQAKIVSPTTLQRMLAYVQRTRQPKRDAVIVLLSVKAGLRACVARQSGWKRCGELDGQFGGRGEEMIVAPRQ